MVGNLALLFTDIEGSTRLARELGDRWGDLLVDHNRIVGGAIASADGAVVRTEGDAFFAVFQSSDAALRAAAEAQRGLAAHAWPADVRVRMGVHFGAVDHNETGYLGLEIHRARRVAEAAHGGQVLLTRAALDNAGVIDTDDLGRHRLRDFPAREGLLCLRIDGRGAEDFPPPRTLDARQTNLPAGSPELFGRGEELDAVAGALAERRLVTVIGRGGIGKSSLARVAGTAALDAFPAGVWWVPLAQVGRSEALLAAVAVAVGAEAGTDGPLEALARRFEGPALVVLDNAEHLTDAATEVERLLERVPDLKLLVTSQRQLRAAGEVTVALGPLSPDAALALFEHAAGTTFGDADRAELTALADALDRLPLALELAAARLALLSPAQLRERISASLEIIEELEPLDRRRSLQRTVEWTLSLLAPDAREVFAGMGAFAGPVEITEIEAVGVAAGVPRTVQAAAALLDCSLITRLETGDGKVRFGMPEALHRAAHQQLVAGTTAARWFRAHAERAIERCWPGLHVHINTLAEHEACADAAPEATLALERAESLAPDTVAALRIVVGAWLLQSGRTSDAADVLAPLDADPHVSPGLRAASEMVLGWKAGDADGDPDGAIRRLTLALELADETPTAMRAATLILRAYYFLTGGDLVAASRDAAQATAIARAEGGTALGGALAIEAQYLAEGGDVKAALALLDESIACGDGTVAVWHHDKTRGDLAQLSGRFGDAIRSYARSLELAERRTDGIEIVSDMVEMAVVLAKMGHDRDAAEVFAIADAECRSMGAQRDLLLPADFMKPAEDAVARLPAEVAAAAAAAGREVAEGQRAVTVIRLALAVVDDAPDRVGASHG